VSQLTHISLVLERESAARANAVEVSGALAVEGTMAGSAQLSSAKSLKPFLHDCRVLSMVICVHLHVRSANIHFVTTILFHQINEKKINNHSSFTHL
jgi:hypothetical protein